MKKFFVYLLVFLVAVVLFIILFNDEKIVEVNPLPSPQPTVPFYPCDDKKCS